MSDLLIERLQQWPSCPAGEDPFGSRYVGDLMKEAADEIERLRKGVEDYRAGNYESPRSHRPRQCPHGLSYWQECDACNEAALAAILKPHSADA